MAPLHPDVIEFLDDQSLLEAYQQMASEERNPFVDHLLAEIQRRNLEI
ncbi:hypothetical protein [Sphingomonas sp. Leaf208]|nr:hypothetical protein [Sphingomonas sp. Leaf208]